jgi:hypothetical protein
MIYPPYIHHKANLAWQNSKAKSERSKEDSNTRRQQDAKSSERYTLYLEADRRQ